MSRGARQEEDRDSVAAIFNNHTPRCIYTICIRARSVQAISREREKESYAMRRWFLLSSRSSRFRLNRLSSVPLARERGSHRRRLRRTSSSLSLLYIHFSSPLSRGCMCLIVHRSADWGLIRMILQFDCAPLQPPFLDLHARVIFRIVYTLIYTHMRVYIYIASFRYFFFFLNSLWIFMRVRSKKKDDRFVNLKKTCV